MNLMIYLSVKTLIILWRSILAALPRSESTPGLVESSGMIPLEEMWVSPMPLYPYCQNSPEPKWVPSFILLLHIIKGFLEEDLIGCFLAKCSVGHLSMFSFLQASTDRASQWLIFVWPSFFFFFFPWTMSSNHVAGHVLAPSNQTMTELGPLSTNQIASLSALFTSVGLETSLTVKIALSMGLRDVDHLWWISS